MMPHNIFLLPGDLHFSRSPCRITTLLGSCVAVCIYDKQQQYGGMNHFVFPNEFTDATSTQPGKYGTHAIKQLLELANLAYSQPQNLSAKLYGGASIVHPTDITHQAFQIGKQNIQFARHYLSNAGIHITAENVGGTHGQRINFHTASGHVQIEHISPSHLGDTQSAHSRSCHHE
jgi:chemotaxis protein CheD